MVSKKTNKILPKDINLLFNKLIIIIKKISNSCGNKNKKIKREGGSFLSDLIKGKPKQSESELKKALIDEINFFINDDYAYSKKFIEDYYNKNLNSILTKLKDKFEPELNHITTKLVSFNDNNINTNLTNNKGFKNYIEERLSNSENNVAFIPPTDGIIRNYTLFFIDNTYLKYIILNQDIPEVENILSIAYNYYILYKRKYNSLQNTDTNIFNDFNINIEFIINSWISNFEPKNDMLVLYYNFNKEYNKIKNDQIIDFTEIAKFLNMIDDDIEKDFYKHLVILNMGNTMKLIKKYI